MSFPALVAAQGFNDYMTRALELNIQPNAPAPGQSFIASLGLVDNGAEITWFINNEEMAQYQNQRKIDLVAPDSGETQTIRVETTNPAGLQNSVSKQISPLYLDIIIEPQTYVPDFYQGRSVPSIRSQVNATALIDNKEVATTDLIYRWEIDGEVLQGGSVRGQNRVSFEMPLISRPGLSLQVTDLQGNLVASKFMYVQSVRPEVLFYNKSILYGISFRPFTEQVDLFGQTNLIEAVPYYLDSRVYNSPDLIEWKLGPSVYQNLSGNPYEITLESSGQPGVVELEFHARSLEVNIQRVRDSIDIRI
jgi:hypothetical protein